MLNQSPTPLERTPVQAQTLPSRELWRWYILLLIANELDLVFTYFGLSQGTFMEANPLVRPHLYTWWPLLMKLAPLAGLALGVYAVLTRGQHLQQRTLGALRLATAIYTIVLVMHVLQMLTSAFTG